ncbi:NAD(P)-binding domain-containing protein [Ideonella sp. 4Y11]|uniref:NAD(P)-binding domain-containing protein n=1 Tax=Ideonella aquatica TaxID=2824119 RepID=A0A940YCD1_9BURK|nr:NAD(P)-binding domain-containing protein [Ideonella aquatica]
MSLIAPYLAVLLLAVAAHLGWRRRRQRLDAQAHAQSIAAGLNEPATLHPVVDPARCIGSGTCVRNCPEGALGIVGGKAVLINASACIGHGACHAACPFDAISLVFGTARRGVDIPLLQPDFQTNVPGIFIAGELGGMGLIRKAAEQGRQAMEAIARGRPRAVDADELDVLIVGAGPAGLSAGLAALERGHRFAILEQESSLGGSIFHYPRQKVAMTAPVTLSLVGLVRMNEISKEDLLAFWHGVTLKHQLPIHYGQRMTSVRALDDGGFEVQTGSRAWRARSVLLAIGRRGTPRTLEVPGEDLPKVAYRLIDPVQYAGQAVLVVGGGDSALEAAIALAGEAGTQVTLSYRGEAFSRVKAKNRDTLAALQQAGRLEVLLASQVERITPDQVLLRRADGQTRALDNQAVIVCAGGVLPTPLLQEIGIRFETKHGSA